MKKFLCILGGLGIIGSSSFSVLACGKKAPVSTDDNILTTKNLIDQFILEISNITYDHLDRMQPNLTRLLSENQDDFFTYQNIITYGNNNDKVDDIPPLPLEESNQLKIIDTFSKLLQINILKSEIQKLATQTDKYKLIILENNIVNDVNFDIKNFSLSYVDNQTFLANANIPMFVHYSYKDYNKNVVNTFLNTNVNLTISDDQIIITGITNLEKNLANDLINSDSSAVWIKAIDTGYTENELYKAFELYNEQKRTAKLTELISGDNWTTVVSDFINQQGYFSNVTNSSLKLDSSTAQIYSELTFEKIESGEYVEAPKSYTESLPLRKSILEKVVTSDSLNFISGTKTGDKKIYDILDQSFYQNYSNFLTKYQDLWNYTGNNLNFDNILFGSIVIQGLNLNFTNLNFNLPLNAFQLHYNFSLTGDSFDVETNSTLDKSALGEAVYKNTEAGIKSFQSSFGVFDNNTRSDYSTFRLRASNSSINFRVPLIFSGTNNLNPLNVNIFDELVKVSSSNNLDNKILWNNFNQVLSLNTDELAPIRYNLLTNGYQGQFGFSIKNSYFTIGQKYISKLSPPSNINMIGMNYVNSMFRYNGENAVSKNESSIGENDIAGFNLGFHLELNLLNAFISLPEFINSFLATPTEYMLIANSSTLLFNPRI